MATRTISNTGGNWNATGAWVEGVVPTSDDDVVATATSGNLTLNVAGGCRSMDLTGYTATMQHNAAAYITIGTTTANPSGVALKLAGGYTTSADDRASFYFNSSAAGELTIDFNSEVLASTKFTAGTYRVVSDFSLRSNSTTLITNEGADVEFDNVSIVFRTNSSTAGSYDFNGSAVSFPAGSTYTSTFGGTTVYWNGATITGGYWNLTAGTMDFDGATWNGSYLIQSGGTVLWKDGTIGISYFSCTGTSTRVMDFGTAVISLSAASGNCVLIELTNLTFSANTGTVKVTTGPCTFNGGGADFNGLTLNITGIPQTITISGDNTFKSIIVNPTTTKTISLTAGSTQTITDNFYCYSYDGEITLQSATAGSAATISKASGTVEFYSMIVKDITATGGATFTAYHNVTDVSGNTGITFTTENVWYVDHANGDDDTITPYGWWSVAYTGATGTMPAHGDTATGATSGKTATVQRRINPYEWGLGSGTLYFIGVNGTFVAEQLDFSSGGHVDIAGDFVKCGWKTLTTGAVEARIAPGDVLHCAKSSDPTLLGLGTWTTRPFALPASFTITSSTNTTPIRITKTAHGLVDGDAVYVYAHTTNTAANGSWTITKITDNTFDLDNSVGNGVGGATGTVYQINHMCVVLEDGCTQTINRCGDDGNWTAGSANYTPTQLTPSADSRREGTYSIRVAVAAGAGTNEKAAYYTLPAELDLSGYQIINFWINTSVALNSGDWTVCLCSDTSGATPVNTFSIPTGPNPINEWNAIVLDNGSALGSSIKSVAVYQVVDKGAFNFHIDNIFVSKATTANDCLTLNSLISKSSSATGGDEPFYPIMSVSNDGRVLMFKCIRNNAFNTNASYCGTTEQVNTYVRHVHSVAKSSVYNNASVNTINVSGIAGKPVKYLGGYDMATDVQNGETYISNVEGWGVGVWAVSKSYFTLSNISVVNFYYGIIITTSTNYEIGNVQTIAQALMDASNIGGTDFTVGKITGIMLSGVGLQILNATRGVIQEICKVHSCWTTTRGLVQFTGSNSCAINTQIKLLANNLVAGGGLTFTTISNANYVKGVDYIYGCDSCVWFENARFNVIDDLGLLTYARANHGIGFNNYSMNNIIHSVDEVSHMPNYGIYYGTNSYFNRIDNCPKNEYNVWALVAVLDTNNGWNNCVNNMVTTGNTNCLSIPWGGFHFRNCKFNEATLFGTALTTRLDTFINSEKHQQIDNNHKIFKYGGLISSDETTRHTASGISWSLSVTDVSRTMYYPLVLSLAKIACAASSEVTFSVYCKKSHATDIGAKILCNAYQLSGMTDYVEDVKDSDTDWELLTVQFTPTEAGVVEIFGHAWWVANAADESVWFDDVSIAQA